MKKLLKKKTARRWLNRNRWNIAKWRLEMIKADGTFFRQMHLCNRSLEDIRFKTF